MIMQRLSSEHLLDTKLFRNALRRRLPHVLVAFLGGFFTLAVPLMMALPDAKESFYTAAELLARQTNCVQSTIGLNLALALILGVYFGVVTCGYMMRRRSAYFWHALPQKRETLYTTSIVTSLCCAALGTLLSLVFTLAVLGAKGAAGAVFGSFFLYFAKNLLWFLVAYAITVFAGSFSGSGVIQVLMSLVITFYPLALYAGLLMLRGLYSPYFAQDYYYELPFVKWLCPVYYAAAHFDDGFAAVPTVCAVLAVVLLLLGALCIYRRRAVENAEKPIVFAKLGSVLKYLMVFIVTVYAGLFFEAVSGGGWVIFGFASGGLLSFLLGNTILEKSPKAMLKGWRGLIIFAVAFALFFAAWSLDVFHTIDRVPEAEDVTRAEVRIGRYDRNTIVTDPAATAALCTLIENQRAANQQPLADRTRGDNDGFYMETVLHTKLGIPVARNYYVYKSTDGAREFLRAYADSGAVDALLASCDAFVAQGRYSVRTDTTVGDENTTLQFDFAAFWEIYRREIGALNYERLSMPPIGRVNIWDVMDEHGAESDFSWNNVWNDLPLYADMQETIAFLRASADAEGVMFESARGDLIGAVVMRVTDDGASDAADMEPMAEAARTYADFDAIGVDETDGYPTAELTAAEAKTLLPHLVRVYVPIASVFVDIDTEYIAILRYGRPLSAEEQEKYDMEATETTSRCNFVAGSVPESIKNKLK